MSGRRPRASQFISPYDLPRLQAAPLVADVAEPATVPLPAVNGQPGRGGTPAVAFSAREHLERRAGSGAASTRLRAYHLLAADRQRLEKYSMLSTMVLGSIAAQRDQAPPTRQEIAEAGGNAAVIGVGNLLGYVFKSASTFLIQRGLQPELFGLYSLSLSAVTLVGSIFVFGLDDAMVRYVAIYRSKKQAHLLRSLATFCTALAGTAGILGALLVFYLAPLLGKLYHDSDIVPYVRMMAPLIPLLCMQVIWAGGLQGFKEFKKRVLSQRILIPVVTGLLFVFAFVFFRGRITAFALVTLVSTLISTLLNLYFLFAAVARASEPGPGQYRTREWLGFAIPNFLTNVVDIVLDSVDTLLLGLFRVPLAAIGQYAAAIKVTGFISMPLLSLNAMFAPSIAEFSSRGEKQKLEAMFKLVTKWSIAFSLPIFGVTTLFATPVLALLSGSSYVAAWPLVIAFAIGGMLNAGTGPVGIMLLMTGRQRLSFLNSLVAIAVNLALGVVLTPRYGALGTAIGTGLASGTVNLMRLLQVRLLLKMHPYCWETLKPLMAWAISALLTGALLLLLGLPQASAQLFHLHVYPQLALLPVFLASYFGLLALFRISPEDRAVLEKIGAKVRKRQPGGRP
jgi:O-antigen/teichoic acid export membrane protein